MVASPHLISGSWEVRRTPPVRYLASMFGNRLTTSSNCSRTYHEHGAAVPIQGVRGPKMVRGRLLGTFASRNMMLRRENAISARPRRCATPPCKSGVVSQARQHRRRVGPAVRDPLGSSGSIRDNLPGFTPLHSGRRAVGLNKALGAFPSKALIGNNPNTRRFNSLEG